VTAVKRTKGPKPGQLNVRQKKFIKNRVAGMGIGESALRAGYATATEGSVLLHRPQIQTALQKAMAKAGIDDDMKAQKLKEGLDATYPEHLSKDGHTLTPAAPDFFTRGQYLDKVLKIGGDYAPDRQIQEQHQVIINVQMDTNTLRGLKDCGVIDAEVIDDGTTGREIPALPGRDAQGRAEEDREEPQGLRQDAALEGSGDNAGGVPAEDQRREGPGEAGDPEACSQGADVRIEP